MKTEMVSYCLYYVLEHEIHMSSDERKVTFMKNLPQKWESLVFDYSRKLRVLDEPGLEGAELEKAKIDAGDAAGRMAEFGYIMAHDLETVRNDLFTKWWFKLFTKLGL